MVFFIRHTAESSSGKTQHFDCCIRRFESCLGCQKNRIRALPLSCSFVLLFRVGFEPISPSFAKQKGHKIVAKRRGKKVAPSDPASSSQKILFVFLRLIKRTEQTLCPLTFIIQLNYFILLASIISPEVSASMLKVTVSPTLSITTFSAFAALSL